MHRLFVDYPRDRLWALTSRQSVRSLSNYSPVPLMERQVGVPEFRIHRRWIDRLAKIVNHLLIPWTVWRGVKLIRKERIEAIFTVPWDHFTIAAYLVHRITRLPIYMYVMDDSASHQIAFGLQSIFYSLFMPRLVRACKQVWGVSDGMCEYLDGTFGVKCPALLPLLDVEDFQKKSAGKAVNTDCVLRIIFTGAIYDMQVDAVRRLVRVIDTQFDHDWGAGKEFRLTLYTSASAVTLRREGLIGENVLRDEVTLDDIPKVLAGADIAFLPLSFDAKMRHVVETSFPSKIAEYLAAGLPILAHAPPYSTVARYCREYGCGLVVDEPNDVPLRDGLLRLANDAALRQKLSAKALETAKKNHDAATIGAQFLKRISCDAT